ncbi:sensor histidine kinase [Microbacterium cremeum]|uniref:sensor histidine kinase n=1 Tax=Microbacterium cremeum TaxID=2782169 RepID=UPI0018897C05|nr:ATP-binding protein [Microbacterium cremeum]
MGRPAVRSLIWGLTAVAVSAVTAALFAVLYERPLPWLMLLYLLVVPIPFLVVGIVLFAGGHRAGAFVLLGSILGPGFAAPLEVLLKARYAAYGAEEWMPWALTGEALIVTWGLACFAVAIGLFPSCIARTRLQRRLVRALWFLPLPMLIALLSHEDVLVDRIAYGELPPIANPVHVPALAFLAPFTASMREMLYAVVAAAIVALVVRYRHESLEHRTQIRWVLFGGGAALAVGLVPFLVQPILGADAPEHGDLAITLSTFAIPLIPLSLLVALEPPTWLDSEAVMRKSFIYGALSLGILAVYAVVVTGLGVTAGAGLPVEVAIAVTAVLAFGFQPLRERLRTIADRWVFGARPAAVLDAGSPDDQDDEQVAARLAQLVRSAVRLRWVAVRIPPGPEGTAGTPSADTALTLPLGSDGTRVGEIRCGPKLTGRLSDRDIRLISALGQQSALLVANRRLAGRIVQVQEAERRRIERNLHDGAQQELVSLVAKLGLARARVRTGSLDEEILIELQHEVQGVLREVRELAQGIHPSVLTDGGLVAAVEDRCDRLPVDIRLSVGPGLRGARFDDDIEGAAYFFVVEALTNVLKHAGASHARVELSCDRSGLSLTVADDGVGFDPARVHRHGLVGLADRFTALGGSMSVDSAPGAGTTVRAQLPARPRGGAR